MAVYRKGGVIVSVEDKLSSGASYPLSLFQNYPNPFNSVTTIAYALPHPGEVKLVVYDITGQLMATLVSQYQTAGHYQASWDSSDFASGVYVYKLTVGEFEETSKMVLLK